MNHVLPALMLLLAVASLAPLAQAQTVWRCGPDGRSFSDTPCTEGRTLALAESRPAEDVAEARALADRDRRLAEKLRRERLKEEADQRGNGLAALGPTSSVTRTKPAPLAKKTQAPRQRALSEDQTWRATAPASRRAKG